MSIVTIRAPSMAGAAAEVAIFDAAKGIDIVVPLSTDQLRMIAGDAVKLYIYADRPMGASHTSCTAATGAHFGIAEDDTTATEIGRI